MLLCCTFNDQFSIEFKFSFGWTIIHKIKKRKTVCFNSMKWNGMWYKTRDALRKRKEAKRAKKTGQNFLNGFQFTNKSYWFKIAKSVRIIISVSAFQNFLVSASFLLLAPSACVRIVLVCVDQKANWHLKFTKLFIFDCEMQSSAQTKKIQMAKVSQEAW